MDGAGSAGRIARLAETVTLAWGWRRFAFAFAGGFVGAAAMPPFGLWPVLAASFSIAIWLIDGSAAGHGSRWRAAIRAGAIGWAFGWGYFIAGLWWLGAAFLVEADRFAILMPLGVLGLPALLAFFPAFGFATARLVWPDGTARILVFAAVMALTEWVRGMAFTGFPWNAFGMAFGQASPLDQIASVIGLHGLNLLVLLGLSAPAALSARTARARRTLPLFAFAMLAAVAIWGSIRIAFAPAETVPGVRLRLMQPNVPQDARFRPEARDRILAHYLALSDRATSPRTGGIADITHLVWPESAFPFILDRDAAALQRLGAFLPDHVTLVTGAARADTMLPGETRPRFFNAIQVLDGDGRITATYDKVHLVPFGEYLPLAGLLDSLGLRQFVAVPGGFTAGRIRRPLAVPGWPTTSPLVCYEAIFPGEAAAGGRPGVLLNVTNDAWFGSTPGPHQHFAQARLRAIEQGVPLVRAANNGISAVVDPWGRVVASLPSGVEGVVDSTLPRASAHTIYARFQDIGFVVLVALLLAIAFGLYRLEFRRSA